MYHTGMYTGIEMPTFRTSLNTGRIGQFRAIQAGTKKKNFVVIFEFL